MPNEKQVNCFSSLFIKERNAKKEVLQRGLHGFADGHVQLSLICCLPVKYLGFFTINTLLYYSFIFKQGLNEFV